MEYGEYVEDQPALNSVRYLVSRIVRLVGTFVLEALLAPTVIVTTVAFGLTLWIPLGILQSGGIRAWYSYGMMTDWQPIAPFLFALGCFLAPLMYGTALALGLPYRWKWKVPGLMMVECGHCKHSVRDTFFCSSCGWLRLERFVSLLVCGLNLIVQCVWMMHDVTMVFLLFV